MKMHLHVNVRGVLKWNDEDLGGMITMDSGYVLTPSETREYFEEELTRGNEILPMGGCDNFDPKHGCMGHPEAPDYQI